MRDPDTYSDYEVHCFAASIELAFGDRVMPTIFQTAIDRAFMADKDSDVRFLLRVLKALFVLRQSGLAPGPLPN